MQPGKRLPYSLRRDTSRKGMIGCTFVLALILGGLAYPILNSAMKRAGTSNNFVRYTSNTSVMYIVGGGFAIVALLLLYAAFHQLFALRTRQTIIEIDHQELRRGGDVQLFVQQFGPASFESLRANLAGEECWWTTDRTQRHQSRSLGTFNVFDSPPFEIDRNVPFERIAVFHVPEDLPPTADEADRRVTWNLEVWGRVRGRADFRHVFPMRVV